MKYAAFNHVANKYFGATLDDDMIEMAIREYHTNNPTKRALMSFIFDLRWQGMNWNDIATELGLTRVQTKILFEKAVKTEYDGAWYTL